MLAHNISPLVPMFLPGVENNPQPGPYNDFVQTLQERGAEYPQIWHLFAFAPQATHHLARFTQEIMREDGPISPGLRELIAAYTSLRNQCIFELRSHAAAAAVILESERGLGDRGFQGEAFVAGVLRDLETSELTEKEKALFRFVDKVNRNSVQIGPSDIKKLNETGWDDAAIYYAITVCALFNFYNRWADASGVHPLSDEAHRIGGQRSASIGYVRE